MNAKTLRLYYLLGWLAYLAYLWADNILEHRGSHPYVWSNYITSLATFTFCFFALYPKLLKRKRIPLFLIGLIVAQSIFIGLRFLIEEIIYVPLIGHGNYYAGTTVLFYIGDNWWRALQPMLLSFIIWAFLETLKRERESDRFRQEKTQAELAFLKSQINPHFLFNTLNYIYSLAYPISDQLAGAILKLSGLMRYMLAEETIELVSLEKEVDHLDNYIDLYRMRFSDRFFVDFEVNGNVEHARIASLILITFVENAFKHGVTDDVRQPVTIHLQAGTDSLYFVVTNRINRNHKEESSGIGLNNIRRRLELIYPDRHELLIKNNGETYESTLIINLFK